MPRGPRSGEKGKPIFVKLPKALYEKAEEIAKEEYWDLSHVLREAFKFFLKEREKDRKASDN